MTQEQVLDVVAMLTFGPSARAGDVVRMCFEDMVALLRKVAPLTWPDAVRLPDDQWTPYPVP